MKLRKGHYLWSNNELWYVQYVRGERVWIRDYYGERKSHILEKDFIKRWYTHLTKKELKLGKVLNVI